MPPAKPLGVGVLALQGDVAEHLRALEWAGARTVAVRTPADLDQAAGLIIPGGESTTIWKLAELFDLAGTLRMRVASGMPVFGSCAGMIMLAGRLAGPGQWPANARRYRHDHPAERVRPAGGLVRERPVHGAARIMSGGPGTHPSAQSRDCPSAVWGHAAIMSTCRGPSSGNTGRWPATRETGRPCWPRSRRWNCPRSPAWRRRAGCRCSGGTLPGDRRARHLSSRGRGAGRRHDL